MLTGLRNWPKDKLLVRWGASHSPAPGVPPAIYRRFSGQGPLALIDVGAFHGGLTLGLQRLCGLRQFAVVEPLPDLAAGLRADPRLRDGRIFECALSDREEEITMQVFPNAPYMSSALALDQAVKGHAVMSNGAAIDLQRQARPLDAISREAEFDRIDLVKLDVQGLEHRVLSGGGETLKRTGALYTEVSFKPLYKGSSVFADIYAMMEAYGFYMSDLEPGFTSADGELMQADALFINRSFGA